MYYFRVLEVRRLKQMGRTTFLLGALGENLFPFLFQLLEAACNPWLMALHHSDICFCCHISVSYSDSPASLFP